MIPAALAQLHAAAFVQGRPWTAEEFVSLLQGPHVALITHPHGFALTRTVARESELLTIAVDPGHQRQGIARRLMLDWLRTAETDSAFLEVAADNHAARALYAEFGFQQIGQRRGYYARENGTSVDALVLGRDLTHGQQPESGPRPSESG